MIYFKGDIVEITTSKFKDYRDFSEWQKKALEYEKGDRFGTIAPCFVGQRFLVDNARWNDRYHRNADPNLPGHTEELRDFQTLYSKSLYQSFMSYDVILFRRPIKNYLLYFKELITKYTTKK